MIKAIFSVLSLTLLFSCGSNTSADLPDIDETIDTSNIIKHATAIAWYAGKDTADAGEVVACSQGYFYKKLDSTKVLLIRFTDPVYTDTTINFQITSANSFQYTELYLFKSHPASIINFCNDVSQGGYEPDTSLTNATGNIVIKFKQPEKNDKLHLTAVSIYIKDLTFIDNAENKIYTVKNRVYWKITNWQWFPG